MGEWAQSGLIKQVAPSDTFREAFYDFTWDAALWSGETYGYPISVESLGLIYNKALVDTPPDSFAELMELDQALSQEGKRPSCSTTANRTTAGHCWQPTAAIRSNRPKAVIT